MKDELLQALKILVLKLASLKNFWAIAATIIGIVIALIKKSPFTEWSSYQIQLLALFYGANQLQKWVFSRWPKKHHDQESDIYH